MCLDVTCNNSKQNMIKLSEENSIIQEQSNSLSECQVKCLCGGSLVNFPPIFDPNGESIYVVWNDQIRMFSIQTGECLRNLEENRDGDIVGVHIDTETEKSLVACTKNGTIIIWKLESFLIVSKLKLNLGKLMEVTNFVFSSIDGVAHGIVSLIDENEKIQLVLVELKKGTVVQRYDIPFINGSNHHKLKISDGHPGSNFFVVVQKQIIFVVDKMSKDFITHKNDTTIKVVVCHPEMEMFATGDYVGRIKLWHKFFDEKPVISLLHWHHQIVLSLAFSQSGTILYSGGLESVLVKWHIKNKLLERDFLPRLSGSIAHIKVDTKHDKIALSIDDNGIQIINSSFTKLQTIQDFTKISKYDLSVSQPFPAGIKLNPRNHHLVMNGRIGHLQFFSTKTMKLLFNIDITMRNVIPRVKKLNIFNTHVTRVALSLEWMATVESWNDRVHHPDSRLKFWKFHDEKQTYSLHTQIEQAHQNDIMSVDFSTKEVSKALICATAGLDNCIKIWSLENAEDVKNSKKIWLCIEELNYKNLPVRHFSFSQDSSLIAAGFGNVLCVWDTIKFSLKCALSAPASQDGSVKQITITLPKNSNALTSKEIISKTIEKRKKTLEIIKLIIQGSSDSENLLEKLELNGIEEDMEKIERINPKDLTRIEKEIIFKQVMGYYDLSFSQKIQIFHQLNIYYKISEHMEKELVEFILKNYYENLVSFRKLSQNIKNYQGMEKYQLQWRFRKFKSQASKRNRKIITIRKLLTEKINEEFVKKKNENDDLSGDLSSIKVLTQITNVLCCSEDFSHLVIVTTPRRLLVWNLLTLQLQGSFKLHTKFITIDPLTNLVAVFTEYDELFVIHPSPAFTIHHQKNIPEALNAIWVPRENPLDQSLTVNWQAKSQLLFLNKHQEVCTFKLPSDDDYVSSAAFYNNNKTSTTNTPFAAMIAQRTIDETMKDEKGITKRFSISGSGKVKDIINLSSHAMPPMRLLNKDFIGSMLSSTEKITKHREKADTVETMEISDDEDDGQDVTMKELQKIFRRKAMEKEAREIMEKGIRKKEAILSIETAMKLRKTIISKAKQDVASSIFLFSMIPIIFIYEIQIIFPTIHEYSFYFYINIVWATFLVFNIIGNLLSIMLIDSSIFSSDELMTISRLKSDPNAKEWNLCDKCDLVVPPRSWHCDICGVCILKRDHHCMFASNCIGLQNHRNFLMFLFYFFIGTTYAFIYNSYFIWYLNSHIFIHWTTLIKMVLPMFMVFYGSAQGSAVEFHLCLYMLILIGAALSGVLIIYHGRLIIKNDTTHDKKRGAYDLGLKENLKLLFGDKWRLSLIYPFVNSSLPKNYWKTANESHKSK
ncbi:CLUMA_CG014403, isoform A [Clunio marinus]|uniref:CLUMA_CG014403, isoform A n=1 Tax=Clunio marinus TaxID=568069 RepID=A0A1J1IN22_9DIPT|nr:CLUMA_CG014403, isoform A [Clunio marinus]